MEKEYDIKNRGTLGPSEGDVKEIDILGRVLKYTEAGITWRADPRHRTIILEHFGFNKQTTSLTKNGLKDEVGEEGEVEPKGEVLQKEEEQGFRALAARANYVAVDVPNIQFPTKEVCRDMSKPSVSAYEKLKRLARYMVGFEEVTFEYKWQSEEEATKIRGYTDSDWAGCRKTRKSASGEPSCSACIVSGHGPPPSLYTRCQ